MMPPTAVSDVDQEPVPSDIYSQPSVTTVSSSLPTQQLLSLAGKTIAITGGGRGLGITLALAVLEAGGHVACLDLLPSPSPVEWAQVAKLAKTSNLSVSYHRCNIADEEVMRQTLSDVTDEGDRHNAPFAGTIACAGIQQTTPALEYPVDDFERMLNVNVTGTFVTCKQSARMLVERKLPGSILIVASMSGQVANRGLTSTAYNTSKGALHQLCRSLAQEWGQYGIRVNTLSPGYIQTAMTDALLQEEPEVEETWRQGAMLGRLGVPDDFKGSAVFLLSEGSSFVTGTDLRVDGGHCASA